MCLAYFSGWGLHAHRLRGVSWTYDFHSEPITKWQIEGGLVHWEVPLAGQATEQLNAAAGLHSSWSPFRESKCRAGTELPGCFTASPQCLEPLLVAMRGVGPALLRAGPKAELAAAGGSRKHRSRRLGCGRKMGPWGGCPDCLGVRTIPPPRTKAERRRVLCAPPTVLPGTPQGQGHGPVYHDCL